MITSNTSEMKIEISGTEDYISDPVLRREKHVEIYRILGEKVDRARIDASEILMGAVGECCSFEGMNDPDAYIYSINLHASEGIAGLEKHLARISDYLHLEYLRVRTGIF